MQFKPIYFDPATHGGIKDPVLHTVTVHRPGQLSYVYSEKIILAVNLALTTKRPLLVTGAPGSGKSTLARNVATVLGWKYYERVVTSRTQARDLLWQFDALRRLSDAQVRRPGEPVIPREAYLEPQALWWSFDPRSATRRGAKRAITGVKSAKDPAEPARERDAVILLDEIDKAEPDVPNDLLEPLDVRRFTIDELDSQPVIEARHKVLMVITTNGERELPPAFVRRCVVLNLPDPHKEWLATIANHRFGFQHQTFHTEVADKVMLLKTRAREQSLREPSTAEFLDTVAACRDMDVNVRTDVWNTVAEALLWKRTAPTIPTT